MGKIKRITKVIGIILAVVLVLGFLLLKAPLYYQARSYVVMYAYSAWEKKFSLLEKNDIVLKIPGGLSTPEKDWFPFVMTFNDDRGFSEFMGRDLSLTILYNFGSFSWNSSSSAFFDRDSPYFNSFYGGYVVQENEQNKIYGFTEEGELNLEETFAVPQYDFKYLVLQSLGCPASKLKMEILSQEITKDVEYVGYEDWVRIDSLMLVNSPEHKFKGSRRAYIQYGNPLLKDNNEEFRTMVTHGRIYARYFPEYNSTVYLYIMSPNINTLNHCDESILSKSVIASK